MDTDIDLNIELTEIPNLSTDMLKRYYVRLYEMPAHCSNRMFYILRVSYRLQELRFGGLSSVSKGFIRKMFETPQPKKPALPAGTVLVRNYKGTDYRIKILKKGVEMDGVIYHSLTAVAYKITGRHLSGRQFFRII